MIICHVGLFYCLKFFWAERQDYEPYSSNSVYISLLALIFLLPVTNL